MATRRATYQDVLDAPAHRVAEIVDGTLYINPRSPALQALAKTRLVAGLGHAFCFGRGSLGGWRIMHEPELHLGEDILVPDVAGWRRERLPRIPETWAGRGDRAGLGVRDGGDGGERHAYVALVDIVAVEGLPIPGPSFADNPSRNRG